MKLLVTGGAGFIGSHVIQQFINRPEVERLVNLDCLTYAGHLENLTDVSRHPKYVFEKSNVCDRPALLRVLREHAITSVLHMASESHVDRSITGPGEFIQTNIVGTFQLLEACREVWGGDLAGKRFHHVSTDEVYGSLGPTGKFAEESPYAPNSPYSASKAASDMLVRSYHHTYGFPTVITNCSNNYGARQYPEKFIPVVIQCVLNRKPIPIYGDGLNVRDWLFVGDHVDALWQVLTRGRAGETYNIGGCNEWANVDVVKLVCRLFDEMAPQLGGNSQRLITFVADRLGHDRRYAIDATKIQRELSWTPRYTFESGMRETIQWYLDHQDWVKAVQSKKN